MTASLYVISVAALDASHEDAHQPLTQRNHAQSFSVDWCYLLERFQETGCRGHTPEPLEAD